MKLNYQMLGKLVIQFTYGDGMEKLKWYGGEIDCVFSKMIVFIKMKIGKHIFNI
jgi:hypothetical protein